MEGEGEGEAKMRSNTSSAYSLEMSGIKFSVSGSPLSYLSKDSTTPR